MTAPFNAGDYGRPAITLHNRDHEEAQTFRFPGVRQYRLQAESFVRKARGSDDEIFTLEQSVLNQKFIDAVYRAAAHDGWENV